MTQKIVVNNDYGGFQLSDRAITRLRELGVTVESPYHPECQRDDPRLVTVVVELGPEASHDPGDLSVVEIPDGVDWVIKEYDGREWVAETHRTWYPKRHRRLHTD